MKSTMCIMTSSRPLWCCKLKCLAISLSGSFFVIFKKCAEKRTFSSHLVCPTYWIPHRLQVIQYIKLELVQLTLYLLIYVLPEAEHRILPVVLSFGQYLHDFGRRHVFVHMSLGSGTCFSLARTSRSFRFFGLLKADRIEFLWIDLVVQDLPKRSQFLVTTFFRPRKPGL